MFLTTTVLAQSRQEQEWQSIEKSYALPDDLIEDKVQSSAAAPIRSAKNQAQAVGDGEFMDLRDYDRLINSKKLKEKSTTKLKKRESFY